MSPEYHIRSVKVEDAKAILDIYNYYILNSPATFEEAELTLTEMHKRIVEISNSYPYLVLESESKVIAYAYATQWKSRSAYRFTCETSIYVSKDYLGKSYGYALYSKLIQELKGSPYKRLIAGISLPNPASIQLHEKLGFSYLGKFSKVGIKFGEWIDVGYWEYLLD